MTPGAVVRVRGSTAIGVVVGCRDDAGDGCVHVVAPSGRGEAWVHPADLEVAGPPVTADVVSKIRAMIPASSWEMIARAWEARALAAEARVDELEERYRDRVRRASAGAGAGRTCSRCGDLDHFLLCGPCQRAMHPSR